MTLDEPNHCAELTPAFYANVGAYWTWISAHPERRIVLAGGGTNQYGVDGASYSGVLAARVIRERLDSN